MRKLTLDSYKELCSKKGMLVKHRLGFEVGTYCSLKTVQRMPIRNIKLPLRFIGVTPQVKLFEYSLNYCGFK